VQSRVLALTSKIKGNPNLGTSIQDYTGAQAPWRYLPRKLRRP